MIDPSLTIVIFGATGDLYVHKLAPALSHLSVQKLLPEHTSIVAFARRDFNDVSFREFTKQNLPVTYIQGSFNKREDFSKLAQYENKLFYLSTPPATYESIIKNIIANKLATNSKILIEKPFGQDTPSAEKLNTLLKSGFSEEQIFRIDHYITQKAHQNLWDNSTVEKVKIILHEKNIIGNRGAFYDTTGAFVDVGQNHMLQILAIVASGSDSSREDILKSVHLKKDQDIIRAQYDGYLQELGVKPDSQTETFFKVTLEIDNEKWKGVDFELEAGKALNESRSIVEICFKDKSDTLIFDLKSTKNPNDAYEKVFLRALSGEHDVFVSMEEVMEEWRIAEEVKSEFKNTMLKIYQKGNKS
jgi:glucose-6-phosphate 1-dehydrogenase